MSVMPRTSCIHESALDFAREHDCSCNMLRSSCNMKSKRVSLEYKREQFREDTRQKLQHLGTDNILGDLSVGREPFRSDRSVVGNEKLHASHGQTGYHFEVLMPIWA